MGIVVYLIDWLFQNCSYAWFRDLGFWFLLLCEFSMFKKFICFAFPIAISDIVACAEEQILNDNNQPDMDDCPGGDNLDDEGEAMVEEALSGT